ncbi:MAG: hypothetical protein MUC97_06295 [Bernardetiaceae bacterium]|jgi:hypothetical protein|nr:hypothetical protein [Bernardetiaceae bacterium]
MKTLFFVLGLVLFTACSAPISDLEPPPTYADFAAQLKPEMTYDDLVAIFGPPARDIGSGLHIYVYPLADLTEIRIGYAGKIFYAKHVDKDGNLIKQLL